jgi:hypothetical protein
VTVPRLWHRLRRSSRHEADPAYFSLGRWGLPVNVVAVVFGVFLLVNIGWPRQAVYDPDGSSAVLQFSAPLAVVVVVVLGLLAYAVMRRQAAGAPPADQG